MRALVAAAFAVLVLIVVYPPAGSSQGDTPIPVEPNGAAGGVMPALVLNGWDIRGPRNLQGGWPGDPNLDIGAGSTANPGDLVLNYDVGRRTLIYDGRKHLIASFGPRGIVFYARPRLRRR